MRDPGGSCLSGSREGDGSAPSLDPGSAPPVKPAASGRDDKEVDDKGEAAPSVLNFVQSTSARKRGRKEGWLTHRNLHTVSGWRFKALRMVRSGGRRGSEVKVRRDHPQAGDQE